MFRVYSSVIHHLYCVLTIQSQVSHISSSISLLLCELPSKCFGPLLTENSAKQPAQKEDPSGPGQVTQLVGARRSVHEKAVGLDSRQGTRLGCS